MIKTKTTIKQELNNKEFWEATYERMIVKQGFSKEDKDLLWKLKEIYKKDIIDELLNGKYEWSTPRKVEIAKHESNKKRIVYIYSIKDRYILGVLYRAISSLYKDNIGYNCFSYKKGINTSNAIEYIKRNRTEELMYGIKMDIHAYFNSVSREKVTSMINELFTGGLKETLEKLMLNDTVYWKNTEIQEWKSLIPGCALGSFFANWCLREMDKEFENKVYARYSDDIVIIEKSKEDLYKDIEVVNKYLNEYGLTMNPEKYKWFEPDDSIDFLGLKLKDDGTIDISDHAKQKIKKQIHRWCKKGRIEIERDNKQFERVAHRIIRQINNKNFFCAISGDNSFGWAMYLFPRINTVESLREIDLYTKDTIRAMKTGHHNKANYKKMTEEEFHELGWISLVQMYNLYRYDYDYFMEIIEIRRDIK